MMASVPGLRPGHATADRRINGGQAASSEIPGEAFHGGRVDGAHYQDVQTSPVQLRHHGLDLYARPDDHDHGTRGASGDLGHRACAPGASDVVAGDVIPGPLQIGRHGHAHRTQPDHSDNLSHDGYATPLRTAQRAIAGLPTSPASPSAF